MMALLLALLLCQDPAADIDRLVLDLAHDLIEVREHAQARLLAIGTPGVSALRKALDSSDAEVRLRAAILLEIVERTSRERPHDEDQLQALLLLRRTPEEERRPGSGATKGARFDLQATSFEGGWIVSIRAMNYLARRSDEGPGRGRLRFDVRGITGSDGRVLAVERCGRCSPAKVYVKEAAGPFKVRLTGTQVWFSPYHIEFQNPQDGRRKRIGDFTIEVAWPVLRVTSDREFPEEWLSSMGGPFKCTMKKGIGLNSSFGDGIG